MEKAKVVQAVKANSKKIALAVLGTAAVVLVLAVVGSKNKKRNQPSDGLEVMDVYTTQPEDSNS